MKGRSRFTSGEAEQIRRLLRERAGGPRAEQKRLRDVLRDQIGFYISDWGHGLTPGGFEGLISDRLITITDGPPREVSADPQASRSGGKSKDEDYVIDLCNEVLGVQAQRQHRFDFLRGDPGASGTGVRLPVDAYYTSLRVVVEYRERQHTEAVPLFDRRQTVSGMPRGEQRARYDELRRELLPTHGIELVEFSFSEFAHDRRKRLLRQRADDLAVVRRRLAKWT
jgi:hypothetical protein